MNWVSDAAVARLRAAGSLPDLAGTKYRVLEGVARGGMGAVYLAEDTTLGRRVALKTLDLPDPSGELAVRMLREAQIVARLEHPGIVPVHDVGRLADGRVFYTMKFVHGDRLDRHLEKIPSLADRLRIFQKICDAVAFAHAHGVLHRDLKPENIMVGPFGEVLVMDWGVAKVLRDPAGRGETMSDTTQISAAAPGDAGRADVPSPEQTVVAPATTAHGAILGTLGYMAPEQARGEVGNLDARADVFALGAILRFLLTGQAPTATTAHARRGNAMPPALAAVCAKAMSHDPAGRYASAQELSAEVARYLEGLPVTAYPESIFRKAQRLYERHRVAVLLVAAYLLMRILLLAVWKR